MGYNTYMFKLKTLEARLGILLKTDLRYFIKGTAHLSIGQIVASGSGLLLTIGLAHFLEQAEYGLYSYILAVAGIASAFTLSGMDTAVAQSVAKGFDRTMLTGFWMKLKWSIPVTIVTLGSGLYYLMKDDQTLGYSLLVIGALSPLLYASSLYGSFFNGKKQFKKIAVDNAMRNSCIVVAILLTAFLTHDVVLIILAYFLTNTFISGLRFWLLARRITSESGPSDTATLLLGKHLSVMDVFSNISTFIDKIIVFQLLGATSLAIYALALAPVKQLQGVSKIVRTLVLPKFSTRSAAELKRTIPHKSKIFFLVSVVIVILYCFFAELAFKIFFPKYHEAVLYSQVLSLSLLFMPFILHTQALTTLQKTKELYILNLTKPIIKIVSLVILVPFYGTWGAIMAFLCFYVIHFGTLYFLFQKAIK